MDILQAIERQSLVLPALAKPAANYLPALRQGNFIYISGQLPFSSGCDLVQGKVGREVSVEDAYEAAKLCCLQVLSQLQQCINSQKVKLERCVKLTGFVNAAEDFVDHPKVINGASDLLIACFGEQGKHTRAAVGCSSLPLNAVVEVEAIFAIAG